MASSLPDYCEEETPPELLTHMSCDYLRSVPIRRLPHPVEVHPIWRSLGSAISSVVAVAISLPFLLGFLLVLPACLSVRWLLLFIHCSRKGSRSVPGRESVRGNDNRWLGTEWRSSVIHAVLVFEAKEGVNVDHFRRLLLKRVIPVYPRLTQRLISLPISAGVGNCWLTDSKFSIDEHVFSGPSFLTNEKELQEYVSKLIEDGLSEDKPPWQLQVFQSFGVNKDTIVILRVHQSIADGTALMRLLCHSLADSQVIEIPERPRFGSLAFCMNVFRACVVGPLTLLLWLFLSAEDCNLLTHRSSWTGSVTVTWSASITLPKVNRIKQVTRSTVNCVMLSALAGALRRLLQGCGVKQPPDVKVVVPMDLRNRKSGTPVKTRLGNKTSSMIMSLPVAVEGCIPRLWATRKTLDTLRTSADPVILYVATAALMSVGSASFARHLVNFLTDKASLQFSSLPGPTSEIFLEGQTLKGIYPILPAQANLGISITTITYADQVFVSVIAERALGPAAELILEYLEDQIEILWKLLLNRRVPGELETSTLFTKTRISESPVKEITSRLNLVQKEVERLSEGKENDKDGKLCTLRAEFSELVDELKRRQSLTEAEDSETSWKPRQRAFSCSTSKKQSINSPKFFRQFHTFDIEEEANEKTGKQKVEAMQQNKSAKFESPIKSKRSSKSNTPSSKDCVINISENNTSFKCQPNKSNQNNDDRRSTSKESTESYAKSRTQHASEKSKRILIPNLDLSTENSKISPLDGANFGVKSQNLGEELLPQKFQNENTKTSFELSELSRKSGPKDKKCDLTYKNYLELVKFKDKQLIQVPYEIKIEDSEEPEIVGGVLI